MWLTGEGSSDGGKYADWEKLSLWLRDVDACRGEEVDVDAADP